MIFYRIAYRLIKSILLLTRLLLNSKFQEMILERTQNSRTLRRPPQGPCVWIHAASGEIEYAKPLIRDLKKQDPNIYILITYFSPSIKKLILNSADWDALVPLPFDTAKDLAPLFLEFNPKILLYARTDVWPELACQAKHRKVPQILFSATFAVNSSRLRGIGKMLTQLSLSQLDQIYCVSEQDRAALGVFKLPKPAQVAGDTRYDQVMWRLQNQELLLQVQNRRGPIWILGSSWPEDEAKLWTQLLEPLKNQRISLIIAPHEISRVPQLKQRLVESNIEAQLWSQISATNTPLWDAKKVLLIDQIGYLAALYKHADIAFIGGSYKYQVHSVMEALAANLPVLVGPFYKNNREASEFLNRFVFLHNPQIPAEKYLNSLPFRAEHLRSEIQNRLGATQKLKEEVTKSL